jgi:hypothetical protein
MIDQNVSRETFCRRMRGCLQNEIGRDHLIGLRFATAG